MNFKERVEKLQDEIDTCAAIREINHKGICHVCKKELTTSRGLSTHLIRVHDITRISFDSLMTKRIFLQGFKEGYELNDAQQKDGE